MIDQNALRWLNWYVQGDDFVMFTEEDGGVVMEFGSKYGTARALCGGNIQECIEQAAEVFPITEP